MSSSSERDNVNQMEIASNRYFLLSTLSRPIYMVAAGATASRIVIRDNATIDDDICTCRCKEQNHDRGRKKTVRVTKHDLNCKSVTVKVHTVAEASLLHDDELMLQTISNISQHCRTLA